MTDNRSLTRPEHALLWAACRKHYTPGMDESELRDEITYVLLHNEGSADLTAAYISDEAYEVADQFIRQTKEHA